MTAIHDAAAAVSDSAGSGSVLSIVIPALNEEEAIGATLRRCIDAREYIMKRAAVRQVEIIVVSDGSCDRTEEIAREFSEVMVLGFDRNRGYGAAIKCGFAHASGDLVAFLDADGTCNPVFFGELIDAMQRERADLVLGSRMGPESKMPLIRIVGNKLFAWLLSALSLQRVNDTASGMRVIRRGALRDLYPLPDGLHFTPAMSARALLEGKLKLVECVMPYAERTGRSKLSVLRDGIRFLSIIVRAAVTFRPARPLLMLASLCGLAAFSTALYPMVFYVRHFRVEDWLIYRVLLSLLLTSIAALLVCAAAIADRIAWTVHGRLGRSDSASLLQRIFAPRFRAVVQPLLIGGAIAVVAPGIVEYVQTAHVQMHWSRAVLGSLLLMVGVMLGITGFLLRMMEYIDSARADHNSIRPPDRLRPGGGPRT